MKCEACGKEGTLDIRATLIRCSFCDGEWGRVNGFWVESKPPRCMDCGGDGKTVEAEPRTCPSCRGTGWEGGVKGGIEPSSPLPRADVPPSPHGSVFGTDVVCMRSVSAEVREIVEWLRVTPMARGVLLSLGSSQDIARLADAIERGEYRVSRDHK
jgi:phage FluMu protein Com